MKMFRQHATDLSSPLAKFALTLEQFESFLPKLFKVTLKSSKALAEEKLQQEMSALGLGSRENPFFNKCLIIAESEWFDGFINVVVLANALVLIHQLSHHPDEEEFRKLATEIGFRDSSGTWYASAPYKIFELVVLFIYVSEMMLKHVAFGVKGYWRGTSNDVIDKEAARWRQIDGTITIIFFVADSIWIILVATIDENVNQSEASTVALCISFISAFRMIRLINPLQKLQNFQILVTTMSTASQAFVVIMEVLFALYYVYAVLGVAIFAGHFYRTSDPLDSSFWYSSPAWHGQAPENGW